MFQRVSRTSLALIGGALMLAVLGGFGSSGSRAHSVVQATPQHAVLGPRHYYADPERLQAIPVATPTPEAELAVLQAPPAPQPAAAQPRPAPPPPPPPPAAGAVADAPGQQFALLNQDRAAAGIPQLSYSSALARVAQFRAQDMLNRDYFSHYDPTTGQMACVQLMKAWGIPYTRVGENIAWSSNPSMANINNMWMNSADHRANILNLAYHQVGIGVATNGSRTMAVEVFSN